MARSVPGIVLLAVLVAFGSGFFRGVQAQDFPYMVPEAPEFDDRGNPLQSSDVESPSSVRNAKRSYRPQVEERRPDQGPHVDYRTVRPYVPRTAPRAAALAPSDGPVQYSAPPQAPYSAPETSAPAPERRKNRRSARHHEPPQQPVQQPPANQQGPTMQPGQIDCSRFPTIIAQAPNEAEMQLRAREYLTCLLQTGWNIEMARKHVINTIQTSYKLTR